MNVAAASRSWHRLSEGLLVVLMACQIGCAVEERPSTRIPSSSPAMIRTQAAQYPPPIQPARPESTSMFSGVTALIVAPYDVPPVQELDQWIHSLMQGGITMVLLDIGTGTQAERIAPESGRGATGIFFKSQWASMIRDVFGELVPLAHHQGLSVFGAVSPRRINWVDPALAWFDRSYDPVHRQLRLSPYMDLFHPAFQEYLVGLLSDLADTGVDGILFSNDAPVGPYDGFSAFAVRAFERDFQTRMEPDQLFTAVKAKGQGATSDNGAAQSLPAEFWRWSGWKARERMKIFGRLSDAMRLRGNAAHTALEVHREAVSDPRAALVRYGEDLLEAKRRFQYFVLPSPSHAVTSGVNGVQTAIVLDQMKALLGRAERIWIEAPVVPDALGAPGTSAATDRAELGTDIGLIYRRN